ncbi:glycosyltransferase [Lentibacillus halophilus]|uniref:Glycosyltransferase n=1 Tax=Lentibacillus halophilus TaxID=295065 RepID=A0ABN0Z6A6_9BACI
MSTPLVTVFIPVYNAQNYIESSLNSIINQSYKKLDILVIDDGSSDNTLEILKAFRSQDNRIRILENENNKGIPYTRNRGLNNAKGEYLAVMDADDIAFTDRIKEQVSFMEIYKNIDVVGCNFIELGKKLFYKKKSKFYDPEELKIRLLFASPIANPSSMIRMSTIKYNNIKYDENYFVAQDYDFWFKISKVGNFAIVPKFLMKYRVDHNNISNQTRKNKALARRKVIQEIHTKKLNYYGFKLDEKAYREFLFFFDDNNNINNYKIDISELASKMIRINENNNVFAKDKFKRVLFYSFSIKIGNLNIPLMQKIFIYFALLNRTKFINIKELLRIIIKHYYFKLN